MQTNWWKLVPHQKAEINCGVPEVKVNVDESNNLAKNFSASSAQELFYKINLVQAFDYLWKIQNYNKNSNLE